MATENILMDGVKRGGDRQALHERIRTHSLAAGSPGEGRGKGQRPPGAHRRRARPLA